ncbi:MAG: tRNA epoxyqueuosine(34) reductase QueG [Tindallia sp. MSAO_Bac2]|nr:MAG: tRNA epoxyqueuosine(34) reductase QueG [Tindallia sp. MSAO_Bac2]
MKCSIEKLRQLAFANNIIDIAVIKPERSVELKKILVSRHQNKRLTDFEESIIEKRINPKLIMPEAKSIIVGLMSYHMDKPPDNSKRPQFYGTLARCARGKDYHRIVHIRMKELMESLTHSQSGAEWKIFVDTGPLVDRHLAAKAGLGFFGRNNCFIHPQYGSFIVIGYILTTLEFKENDYVSKTYDKCSECGECQQSCPAKAINTPFQIDNQVCLSHALQQKGIMDKETMLQSGVMMYGCDICQDVCPHNYFARNTPEPLFHYKDEEAWLNLPEILQVSNREFNRRYRSASFGWRGRRIMQRNALKSLGNTGNTMVTDHVKPFLEDQREDIRKAAEWAMDRLSKADE